MDSDTKQEQEQPATVGAPGNTVGSGGTVGNPRRWGEPGLKWGDPAAKWGEPAPAAEAPKSDDAAPATPEEVAK